MKEITELTDRREYDFIFRRITQLLSGLSFDKIENKKNINSHSVRTKKNTKELKKTTNDIKKSGIECTRMWI